MTTPVSGGTGTPHASDQTADPGYVDFADGNYRIAAGGAAELFVDQAAFDNAAYQIEQYVLLWGGLPGTWAIAPDIYGHSGTYVRYTAASVREPESAGAVNGGAYNYRGATRSLTLTMDRTRSLTGRRVRAGGPEARVAN